MKNRPKLLHLLLIALGLAALAAGALYYTNATEPVAGIPAGPTGLSAQPSETSSGLDAVLYFPNTQLGSDQDCGKVFPVHRAITDTVNDSPYLELLKGPTAEEKKLGYFTSIPEGVKINSITVRKLSGGTQALIDFSAQMNKAAGSCRVASIRAEIEQTAMHVQPDPPSSVVISVDGEIDTALQP